MMSEEKYTTLIEQTKQGFKSDQPLFAPPMSAELRRAVRERRRNNGIRPLVKELLQQKIAVWQAAACAAGILFAALFGLGRDGTQAPTVYVYLTDTIYKMIPIPAIEPDWSDTVARAMPSAMLEASLHQEKTATPHHNNALAIQPGLVVSIDTGRHIAFDSSLHHPVDLFFYQKGLPAEPAFEQMTDSFQRIH